MKEKTKKIINSIVFVSLIALGLIAGAMIRPYFHGGSEWHSKDYKEILGVKMMHPYGMLLACNTNNYPVSLVGYNLSNDSLVLVWNKTLPPADEGDFLLPSRAISSSPVDIICICDGTHAEVVRYGWWDN